MKKKYIAPGILVHEIRGSKHLLLGSNLEAGLNDDPINQAGSEDEIEIPTDGNIWGE